MIYNKSFKSQRVKTLCYVASDLVSLCQKGISIFCKLKIPLSYDVASESERTPCNKIDKPLVVYRFTGNVMASITTLRT